MIASSMKLAGWKVEVVDSSGEVVASTLTNKNGKYAFNVQSGLRTDTYTVPVVKDAFGRALSNSPSRSVRITKGDEFSLNTDLCVPFKFCSLKK
jgi:hypothetical protein